MTKASDSQLLGTVKRELFSAVLGDVMDKMDLRNQFLPPQIQPLAPHMTIVGRAMPVLAQDTEYQPGTPFDQAYGLLFDALDHLNAGDVYICTGASPNFALWGELMSIRAMKLGAAGAIVDGYSRDTPGILHLDFPAFSYGRYAQDQAFRGKVVDYDIPISLHGVDIAPGDLILGDLDGVCVVPKAFEKDVITQALEKVHGEKLVRTALENGMSAAEAFKTYGIM